MKKLFIPYLCCCIYFSAPAQQTPVKVSAINQSKLKEQLLELLDYSKVGFDGIGVEKSKTVMEKDKISGDTSLILYYKPEFTLEGAKENLIKVTLPNFKNKDVFNIEFIATYGDDLLMSEAEKIYNNLSTLIKKDFTSDFETYENKWDLSKTGDIYTKTLYVKPKNDTERSFTLYLSPGLFQGGKYLTTVEIKIK